MEKDFTHSLNILETLRRVNLKHSTIETVIQGLHTPKHQKRDLLILNTGKIPCIRTDYHEEISGHFLIPYEIKPHRFYTN